MAAATAGGVLVLVQPDSKTEKIRSAIYTQIDKAGWKNKKPDIFRLEGQQDVYITGPLPVTGGCHVKLAFTGNDGRNYRVKYYMLKNPRDYVMSVIGNDNQEYPDALSRLQNPTKPQLDTMLTKAGLTRCETLGH